MIIDHISDNERDYYLSKITKNKSKLTKYLVCSFVVMIFDLVLCYFFPERVSIIHLIGLILFSISICISLVFLRISIYDNIKSSTYTRTVFMVYCQLTVIIFFYGCLVHFFFTRIIFKWSEAEEIYQKSQLIMKICLCSTILIAIILNTVLPFLIINKAFKIKKNIKSFGNILGQEYSVTYHVSVPTLDISSGNIQMNDTGSNNNNPK